MKPSGSPPRSLIGSDSRAEPGCSFVWPNQLRIGFHLSIASGAEALFRRFRERCCGTFQIFINSPRVWAAKPWKETFLSEFTEARAVAGSPPLIVHTRYLLNCSSANPEVRKKSVEALRFEYQMASACGADYLVLHMGSHADRETGIGLMIETVSEALTECAGEKPLLLLENTAGEKNDIGAGMGDIQQVRDGLHFPTGVCFDTCHAFQAGYDLRAETGRKALVKEFREILGDRGVRVVHLNDSMNPFAKGHDRHEDIGLGHIGAENLARLLQMPYFKGFPVILETPQSGADDPTSDLENLKRLNKAFSDL